MSDFDTTTPSTNGGLPPPATEKKAKAKKERPEPQPIAAAIAEAGLVSPPALPPEVQEALDHDEDEFRRLRSDLPGSAGASAVGIITLVVHKDPAPKNDFFRTHATFRPRVPLVNIEVGMEKQFFAVDPCMKEALRGIGITYTDHLLYLTMASGGGIRVVPINCETENEYIRTKEIGLLEAVAAWKRIYHDTANKNYKVFPAPVERFDDPQWPALSEAKIFRLSFRDKGRLLDSTEHALFKKWAARDK